MHTQTAHTVCVSDSGAGDGSFHPQGPSRAGPSHISEAAGQAAAGKQSGAPGSQAGLGDPACPKVDKSSFLQGSMR